MKLPVSFEGKMKNYLKDQWEEYLESYGKPGYYGMRSNPLKIGKEDFIKQMPYELKQVPWCEQGFYYDGISQQPAKHPYYHAGLYYIQEPSAMLPASLLPVEPGDKVLDLCAAPGGKSTQIAGKLQGKGLLVSNDISISRAKALVKNLEMAGVTNAVVTSDKPEKLSRVFPEFFDKILVDAPCSGEGMFRKNPLMVKDYEERGVAYYAPLQKEIVGQAIEMLKPGGILVYSTCTFSPEENEGLVDWVLERYPELSVEDGISFPGRDGGHPEWLELSREEIRKAYRMWPHRIQGEGHFAVILKKNGDREVQKPAKVSAKVVLTQEADQFLKAFGLDDFRGYYLELDHKLYLVPEEMPEIKGVRVVRSGLYLGLMKKNRFEPSQALAMALSMDHPGCIDLSIEDERVVKYLKCETIMLDGPDGYVLIGVEGYPLGWGKLKNGMLKNKYAPAWRLM